MRKNITLIILFCFMVSFSKMQAQKNPHKFVVFECNVCHFTENWHVIHFNHDTTNWALEKQHREVNCLSCHSLDDFSDVRAECISCHLDVHQGKLQKKCDDCHTPAGWAVFEINKVHQNTVFPIIGAHVRLDCGACHYREIVGEFSRLNTDCIFCHKQDYLNTKNPQHSNVGFGQRCEDCHSMYAWQPGVFKDHDSHFPITSGEHKGAWDSCENCHITPGNYKIFSCIDCHEHNRNEMDEEHRGEVSGYIYESNACYSCHPTGGE